MPKINKKEMLINVLHWYPIYRYVTQTTKILIVLVWEAGLKRKYFYLLSLSFTLIYHSNTRTLYCTRCGPGN